MARLPKGVKPSKCASKDRTRPVLEAGYIRQNGDKWQLETCDSFKLAVVPLKGVNEGEVSEGFVTPEALKALEKTRSEWIANGTVDVEGVSYPRPDLGRYPNTDQLWPQPPAEADKFEIGINAKFLYELAQAMGSDEVKLTIDLGANKQGKRPTSQLRPMTAEPLRGAYGARGLIVPIKVNV